jgi:hypothetical protein
MYVANDNEIKALNEFLDQVLPKELMEDIDEMFDSWVIGDDDASTSVDQRSHMVWNYRCLQKFLNTVDR